MSNPETDQLSSIRAVRPVIASESLRHFIKCANKLVTDGGFEIVDSTDSEILVFAASSLHATLYARRAPATKQNNDRLRKVVNYIESEWHEDTRRVRSWPGGPFKNKPKRKNPLSGALQAQQGVYIPDGEQPVFRADKIVDCTRDDPARGFELALLVEPGPVADVLMGQSILLNDAAARTNADKLLPRQDHNESPLEIPFMRAPFRSESARDEYIEALSVELPVHSMGLRAISYKHALIDV
jgi:hypothetical protein